MHLTAMDTIGLFPSKRKQALTFDLDHNIYSDYDKHTPLLLVQLI